MMVTEDVKERSLSRSLSSSLKPMRLQPKAIHLLLLTPHNFTMSPPQPFTRTFATIEVPVREALNQAIDEEMERDDAVYIMGEEVAQYQGALQITKGE